MKKRMILPAILLAVLMALTLTLAACGNGDDSPISGLTPPSPPSRNNNGPADNGPDDPPETTGETGTVTRGAWDGHVYTNESLGFRFVMPAGWAASTEEEIAEVMGLGADMLGAMGGDIPEEIWDLFGMTTVHDMMASNPLSGASVQVIYERLTFPHTRISASDYIETTAEQLEAMGVTITNIPGTTRLGNYDWHALGTGVDMFGVTISGRQFVNVSDGFARLIVITYLDTSESFDDIMLMFIGLNDPIPEAPEAAPIEHSPDLVGTWDWDEDASYVYTFYADGRGTRGFGRDVDRFEWRTEGNDHLIMTLGPLEIESWTFTISDDVLTLSSRQVPGMEFSYIRS